MYRSTAVTLLLGGALAGCTVGPNYARPAVDAPAGWRTSGETTASLADMTWWVLFQDPAIFIIPVTFYVSERFRRKREKVAVKTQALA